MASVPQWMKMPARAGSLALATLWLAGLLPQLTMALGTLVLAIAFVDELLLELRGARAVAVRTEALRNE